jgi:hypothetical protein
MPFTHGSRRGLYSYARFAAFSSDFVRKLWSGRRIYMVRLEVMVGRYFACF